MLNEKKKKELIESCVLVRSRAYAKYSKFPVGAAILMDDGKIYSGCNVENMAFPSGWCAEVSALASAISAGTSHVLEAVAVSTEQNNFTTPCGNCRQALKEFAPSHKDVPIILVNKDGTTKDTTLNTLLPDAAKIDF